MSDCEARDCSSQAIYQCLCTRQIKLCEFHYDDHYNRCRISSRIILPQREIFNQKSFDLSSKQDNMLISKRISKQNTVKTCIEFNNLSVSEKKTYISQLRLDLHDQYYLFCTEIKMSNDNKYLFLCIIY